MTSELVVRRITATEYRAQSRSFPGVRYPVLFRDSQWRCSCPRWTYKRDCAHVRSVVAHSARFSASGRPLCDRCGAELRQVTRRYAGNDYRTQWECTRWWENSETGQLDTCATAA